MQNSDHDSNNDDLYEEMGDNRGIGQTSGEGATPSGNFAGSSGEERFNSINIDLGCILRGFVFANHSQYHTGYIPVMSTRLWGWNQALLENNDDSPNFVSASSSSNPTVSDKPDRMANRSISFQKAVDNLYEVVQNLRVQDHWLKNNLYLWAQNRDLVSPEYAYYTDELSELRKQEEMIKYESNIRDKAVAFEMEMFKLSQKKPIIFEAEVNMEYDGDDDESNGSSDEYTDVDSDNYTGVSSYEHTDGDSDAQTELSSESDDSNNYTDMDSDSNTYNEDEKDESEEGDDGVENDDYSSGAGHLRTMVRNYFQKISSPNYQFDWNEYLMEQSLTNYFDKNVNVPYESFGRGLADEMDLNTVENLQSSNVNEHSKGVLTSHGSLSKLRANFKVSKIPRSFPKAGNKLGKKANPSFLFRKDKKIKKNSKQRKADSVFPIPAFQPLGTPHCSKYNSFPIASTHNRLSAGAMAQKLQRVYENSSDSD